MRVISAAVSGCALALVMNQALAADAAAGLGFELGLNWHFPQRTPMKEGQGQYLAFDVDMGSVRVGYRFEMADYCSTADDNATGIADEVNYETHFHEIRVLKPIYDDAIQVGLAVGMAKVHATLTVNAEGGPEGTMFDRLAPTGDIFVVLSPFSGGKRVHAAFNVTMGYRFLRIAPADPDQVGTDYQDDLSDMSGFHLGVSLSAWF